MSERTTIELSPEVAEAAAWIQRQINENPFAEVAVNLSIHDGNVRRVDRTLTTKTKPTDSGAHYGTRNRR